MNDTEHYGNFTIEAISSGVGFKSRTSFVTSFKRFTGLTPSEYQAQAKRENSYK
jgi:AraC-like DNA-binding protein